MFIIIDILLEFIFDDNIITDDVLPFYPEGREQHIFAFNLFGQAVISISLLRNQIIYKRIVLLSHTS